MIFRLYRFAWYLLVLLLISCSSGKRIKRIESKKQQNKAYNKAIKKTLQELEKNKWIQQ